MLNYKLFTVFAVILTATIFYDNAFAIESKCSNSFHVMVERPNGNNACVTERTADRLVDRLGWIIIQAAQPPGELSVSELNIIPNNNPSTPLVVTVEKSDMQNERHDLDGYVSNPTGYWVPFDDRDAFAKVITEAAGDSIIEIKNTHYKTTLGDLYIADYFNILNRPAGNVNYKIDVDADEDGYEEYVVNFLAKMGFQYDEIEYRFVGNGFLYSISNDYGSMDFRFYPHPTFFTHTDNYNVHSVVISFDGWTNNPELVPTELPLSKEDALKKLQVFARDSSEQITKELWPCEFELYLDNENLDFQVQGWDQLAMVGGIPHYGMQVGSCLSNSHAPMPVHFVNAYDETDMFIVTRGPID